jgi:hypothetical protein
MQTCLTQPNGNTHPKTAAARRHYEVSDRKYQINGGSDLVS